MAEYKTHLFGGVIGLAISYLFSYYLDYFGYLFFNYGLNHTYEYEFLYVPEIAIMVMVALYCSILPDVDIQTSIAFAITIGASIIFIIIGIFVNYINVYFGLILLITIIVVLVFGMNHRGWTHHWAFVIITSLLITLSFSSIPIGMCAFFSGFSHLLFDMEFGF